MRSPVRPGPLPDRRRHPAHFDVDPVARRRTPAPGTDLTGISLRPGTPPGRGIPNRHAWVERGRERYPHLAEQRLDAMCVRVLALGTG